MEPAKATVRVKKYKNFYQAVGKRKSAVARVRLSDKEADNKIEINGQPLKDYYTYETWQKIVTSALELVGLNGQVQISVKVQGGGPRSQAEAIRHGISRVLLMIDENHRKPLKAVGFLTRDPRVKERKKPGLKRARRAPQWQKR
ncbi:MAG: 30S ribosomal protein S9 [Candidatus Komeilibacteria bacterium]|nr:30S ribosomal protein S9 [Candidatus Komeilibacteria bacterium]